ncbi:hypothetical protein Q5O24_08940 [Eubacteriaceae bacterium ES3]|nr:hypothetical protein Q5O24_08940 [Eubacteriaceae bacterium ES3]
MIMISLGVTAFLFFVLYDINSIILKRKLFKQFFFIGIIMLVFSTSWAICSELIKNGFIASRMIAFGIISIVMLGLLIYTLFFALPFKETYVDGPNKICQTGIYALCRHPGVLFFAGFYFFIWLAFDSLQLFWMGLIFNICNLIYVIFQDSWTFTNLFEDYKDYQRNTPFLIPNKNSFRVCCKSWHSEME